MASYSRKRTGVCSHHRWMRSIIRSDGKRTEVAVGLQDPLDDDLCFYCRQPRFLINEWEGRS